MRLAPLTVLDGPRSLPEIHLQLLAWQALHPPEWWLGLLRQTSREAFDRVIRAVELVLRHQILVDALRRKPGQQPLLDHLRQGGALTDSSRLGAGGRNGW